MVQIGTDFEGFPLEALTVTILKKKLETFVKKFKH